MPLAHHLSWTPGPKLDGRHGRGFVYQLIRDVDETIHDQNAPAPFSVCVRDHGLRINTLTSALDEGVGDACRHLVGQSIRLGTHRLQVRAARAEGHPVTLASSYADLLNVAPHADCTFRLVTPLFFRRAGKNYALPKPGLVFGSLVARWNAYGPVRVPDAVAHALASASIRYFDIRTVPVTFETRTVGSVGLITYHLAGMEDETKHWAQALSQFAYFSGVGAKTSMGLGEVAPGDSAEFAASNYRPPGLRDAS